MNNKNRKNRILCFFSLIFVAIYGIYLLCNRPGTLTVRATGEKDPASFGTDLRIERILVNGKELTENDVSLYGQWTVAGNSFAAIMADESAYIELSYNKKDSLEIVFIRHNGSGYAVLEIDGQVYSDYNLYNAEFIKETITVKSTNFAGKLLPQIAYLIYGLILLYAWIQIFLNKIQIEKYFNPNANLTLLIASAVLFFSVEYVNSNLFSLDIISVSENIVFYLLMMSVLYLITGKTLLAISAVSVFWILLSIANYYVTLFRGTMLTPTDFLVVETAKSVADNYEFFLTNNICIAVTVMVIFISVAAYLEKHVKRSFKKILVGIVVTGFISINIINKPVSYWNINSNLRDYGFSVSMAAMTKNMYVAKPAGYSSEKAAAKLETYQSENNGFSPNIIVVMNESFSDLSVLNSSIDSNTYMPYYNSLQENTVKGIAVSSTLGGGTSNSEWEFLTSNSMMYVPSSTPYVQFITDRTNSVVQILKDRGYYTAAMHPYYADGYNRISVYQNFGFDDFIDIKDFDSKDYVRNWYLSDKANYEKIIEVFENEEKDAPVFLFDITMQNHSGYSSGYFGDDVVRLPQEMGNHPDAEEYLTLIKKSDEAIHILIDYFSSIEEPTVVLFFGDHQPYFDSTFYDDVYGADTSLSVGDRYVKMFQVPFFIWANYDIEEQRDIRTSLNYLSSLMFDKTGIPTTEYQNYLLDLINEYPVICKTGCEDAAGVHYYYRDVESMPEKLQEYWYYQYYNMFE